MNAHIPLHRLVRRSDAEAILQHLKLIVPGIEAAILDHQGQVFAGEGEWGTSGQTHLLTEEMQPASEPHNLTMIPISVDDGVICHLAFDGSIGQEMLEGVQFFVRRVFQEAWDKRQLGQETLDRYREVNLLYRIGETLGKNLDPQAIPGLLLDEIANIIQYDVGIVVVGENLTVIEARGQQHLAGGLCQAGRFLLQRVRSTERPDIGNAHINGQQEGVVLCAPIKGQGELHGVVALGRLDGGVIFTAGDEKLVMAVTHQAAVAYETSRLHQQEIQHRLLDQELNVGRQIQLSLLPDRCPQVAGWEFAAIYQAARQVGGDFYDFMVTPRGSDWLGLVIADVTGKGVPAAIFMALSRTIIRAESRQTPQPSEVLQRVNQSILEDNRSQLFMTAFYAVLNVVTGELIFTNGGHEYPIWKSADGSRLVEAPGFIIGAFRNIRLTDHRIEMKPGDVLVLYTDGITEARNDAGEFFNEARLTDLVLHLGHLRANEIVDAILAAVQNFAGNHPQSDDFTLVVIKRQAGGYRSNDV